MECLSSLDASLIIGVDLPATGLLPKNSFIINCAYKLINQGVEILVEMEYFNKAFYMDMGYGEYAEKDSEVPYVLALVKVSANRIWTGFPKTVYSFSKTHWCQIRNS